MTVLDFDGIAFDPTGVTTAAAVPDRAAGPQPPTHRTPTTTAAGIVAPRELQEVGDRGRSARAGGPIAEIRTGVVAAHRSALSAQVALQRALWWRATGADIATDLAASSAVRSGVAALPARAARALTGASSRSAPGSGNSLAEGPAAPNAGDDGFAPGLADRRNALDSVLSRGNGKAPGQVVRQREVGTGAPAAEGSFKPLARTTRTALDQQALSLLTRGDLAAVFGPSYRRGTGAARLASSEPLVLTAVETIELYGGNGAGRVLAQFAGSAGSAARQAAEVFALFTGMPLCLAGGTLTGSTPAVDDDAHGTVELVVDQLDLVPRPHVVATAHFPGGPATVTVTVTVTEPAHAPVGPGAAVPDLLLNEFHMAHLARGDQAIAMGPEFAPYTGVRATRLPTGGLLLVDRVVDFDGARGTLDHATYRTEYDSPADSWYYADTANESMPHFVYMETSLQAALLMGYYAGPTLTQPGVTLSLRNLGGTATVLRQVDLRDRTIAQTSRLLTTTILPGSSLQTFDYTLSVDGEPFYAGETMFGYFSDEALANQTGLDAGKPAPTWLATHPHAPARTIDVAARRADPDATLCSRRTLALIDRLDVVDGGGDHAAGYLHSLREIDPDDWFFARHFHLDPVIPGSLGVESVIHAVQEWMLDAGMAADLTDPVFRIPADIAFSWRYRGQFLPTDGTVELEAHIKDVRRGPHGVTVVVDGSLWKPGLRIYEVTDLAVELADRKA